MSDTFLLCPQCGEELDWFGWMDGTEYYYCEKCMEHIPYDKIRIVKTEYLEEEEHNRVHKWEEGK